MPLRLCTPDTSGQQVSLSDFKGRRVILYFYPKDDTPGCTKEACGFRDAYADFTAKGAVILGVSTDSVKSHDKFTKKFAAVPAALRRGKANRKRLRCVGRKNLHGPALRRHSSRHLPHRRGRPHPEDLA